MTSPDRASLIRSTARAPWLLPALVLVLLAALALLDRRQPRTPVAEPSSAGAPLETLGAIEADARNPVRSVLRIQWTSCAGAEEYEVCFWAQDMRELGRYRTGRTNSILLDLQEVWRPVAPSRQLYWRVVALARERELAASDLRSLQLP